MCAFCHQLAGGLIIPLGGCAKPRWLGNVVRLVWVRRDAGILILLFGVYTLAGLGGHAGHGGKQAGHSPSGHQSMPQENQ